MRRKIWLEKRCVTLDVKNIENFDYYTVEKEDAEDVVKAMRNNGMSAGEIIGNVIQVCRRFWTFKNKLYTLNQCSDVLEWIKDSETGEFTYCYDKVLFHTKEGFYAAYFDNISNSWKI